MPDTSYPAQSAGDAPSNSQYGLSERSQASPDADLRPNRTWACLLLGQIENCCDASGDSVRV